MHLVHVRVDATATGLHVDAVCGPRTPRDETSCKRGEVIDSVTIGEQPASVVRVPDFR
jgi:hypothetical protein